MSDIKTIDARGLSCPQPVMLVRKEISEMTAGVAEVLLDSGTAQDNVTRLAENSGWNVTAENLADGTYRLTLKK